ncbi:hypothetical protein C491_16457 [Natronococcus amylolyticus DSM 10524]|uniref:Uncharacterized protein n=1 Tax=Natronococcus amylolyticus DSM 10524 TaxID=1227497 RepID=L9X0S4_9EURY|nr:hypothetical protein [Natronococcus amylolyticus]ELY55325.1 hypothetical protein C491_16457 [Natronococcus amylolyticus DSM 10524]
MNDTGRSLDEALLRAVARRLGSLTVIDTVRVFPRQKPESVVATLEDAYYPEEIRRIELEARAYRNGDFNVTYREARGNDDWMARWDRHDNPHNSRDHYHQPPRARATDAVDKSYPTDFFDVVELVLAEVDARLGELWEQTDD